MTREEGRRRRKRRPSRKKAVLICLGGLILAAGCLLGAKRLIELFRTKSKEKFIRGNSGGLYTPAGAAKRAVEKMKGEP